MSFDLNMVKYFCDKTVFINDISSSFHTHIFLAIIILILWTGIRAYRRAENSQVKILSLVTVLSFVTYALHGLMNNFLDSDKASVPFWGFAAVIVAIDIYHCSPTQHGQAKSDEESVSLK